MQIIKREEVHKLNQLLPQEPNFPAMIPPSSFAAHRDDIQIKLLLVYYYRSLHIGFNDYGCSVSMLFSLVQWEYRILEN